MGRTRRNALGALSILSGFLAFGIPPCLAEAVAEGVAATDTAGAPAGSFRSFAEKGAQALEDNRPDTALDLFMEAHRLGMSKDSLYFFLAEAALAHSAFDTAMAFNLSINPPPAGPFRETILGQRYRLYQRAGLTGDAVLLADSLAEKPVAPSKRDHEFNIRFYSGYFGEDNHSATEYPFGTDLGGYRASGPQFRHRGQLLWPLLRSGRTTWKGGLEYDLSKSYMKDSLDYRTGVRLKAEDVFKDGLSVSVGSELGKVTGTGLVSAYRLEANFLSLSGMGITMIQGVLETELDQAGENRFSVIGASCYRDHSLRDGWGFNYSLSVSGILVEPIRYQGAEKVMYVDDVLKAKPVHYRDSSFQDTLPAKGISTYLQYTSNTGIRKTSTYAPQSFMTVLPSLGYGFPLPFSCNGEIGGQVAVNIHPEAYAWTEAALPAGSGGVTAGFRGFALNQADGRRYSALLVQENGGFQERYGSAPVSEKKRMRVDSQAGAELSIRRAFAAWGSLALNGMVKRNWSTLADVTPIWIPRWDLGASMKWSRGWAW
ncbi:MAG: hypothetical protein JWP91_179 [Fibrobacteres bacterium]|nr:hypothetical protein [Fibrobacterota bacterium]